MPSSVTCAFVGAPVGASTFAPRRVRGASCACSAEPPRFARHVTYAALDPMFMHHLPHLNLSAASHLLAAVSAGAETATAAIGEATEVVRPNGPINSIAGVIEGMLSYMHVKLQGAGVPGAYGVAIILFTGAVKALTFPLNWKQMESTMKMQAINPKIQAIREEYKDNPSVINQMTAKLYKDEKINPLLGCAPIFLQLPIWLALYRALQNLSKENLLNEPFFWIPSLQGPVSQTGQGLNTWLFPLIDGQPPIGWHDALSYLILPAMLVLSQIISSRVMMPSTNDPNQQSAASFNNIIPVIIGWFALNVPSALGVYMFANNVFSTAQTVYVRRQMDSSSASDTDLSPDDTNIETAANSTPPDGFQGNGAPSVTASTKARTGKPGKAGKTGGKAKRRKRR